MSTEPACGVALNMYAFALDSSPIAVSAKCDTGPSTPTRNIAGTEYSPMFWWLLSIDDSVAMPGKPSGMPATNHVFAFGNNFGNGPLATIDAVAEGPGSIVPSRT